MMEQKAQEALEASLYHQEENYKLALKISKIVHDHCKDAPHDIGLRLSNKRTVITTSSIQRILRIGYNDSVKIISELEKQDIFKRRENGWQLEINN